MTKLRICTALQVLVFWLPLVIVFTGAAPINGNYRVEMFSTESGLSSSLVNHIYQDSHGIIWISTPSGLNRYDGSNIQLYRRDGTGLSLTENNVNHVVEDSIHHLWIRYGDYGLGKINLLTGQIKNYQHNESDPNSLSSNYFVDNECSDCMVFDKDHRAWIGTDYGVNIYNERIDGFDKVFFDQGAYTAANQITTLYLWSEGVWVGTLAGLYHIAHDRTITHWSETESYAINHTLIDPEGYLILGTDKGVMRSKQRVDKSISNLTFERLWYDPVSTSSDQNWVWKLFMYKSEELWVGTRVGLVRLDLKSKKVIKRHFHQRAFLDANQDFMIKEIFSNEYGEPWVFPRESNKGVYRFNGALDEFEKITLDHPSYDQNTYPIVRSLCFDKTGGVWMGTVKSGVIKVDLNQKGIKNYRFSAYTNSNMALNDIYAIQESSEYYWVGTADGLLKLNKDFSISNYLSPGDQSENLPYHIVGAISSQVEGDFWLGYYDGKVSRLEIVTGKLKNYLHAPEAPSFFEPWSLRTILVDGEDKVWFGAYTGGLVSYDARKNEFSVITDKNKEFNLRIHAIQEKDENTLWLGTRTSGLITYNKITETFSAVRLLPNSQASTDPIFISSMVQVNDSILWIGSDHGLIQYDHYSGKCTFYNEKDGLVNQNVKSICEDKNHCLWAGTNFGLSKFDPATKTFTNYFLEDGLPGNEFNERAIQSLSNGLIAVGGSEGLSVIDPDRLQKNPYVSAAIISQIYLHNKAVGVGDSVNGDLILSRLPKFTSSLHLSYLNNYLGFEFASPHYVSPKQNTYSYRLLGLSDQWVEIKDKNVRPTYTDLQPGKYTLQIKAANNDGVWSNRVSELIIHISPPWWRATWFKIAVGLFLVLGMLVVYKIRVNYLKRSNKTLQRLVKERTLQLQESNEMLHRRQEEIMEQQTKLAAQNSELITLTHEIKNVSEARAQFFTNISHEIRTPLTLILSPLQLIQSRLVDSETIRHLHTIQKNAQHLLRLINQLLDFRKAINNEIQVFLEESDLVAFTKDCMQAYISLAELKSITLSFTSNKQMIVFAFDHDKMEKIIDNLLSNAFKHTPEHGEVMIDIQGIQDKVIMTVANSGLGISEEDLPHLFERYYARGDGHGTGIGLALCSEFVEAHNGKIGTKNLPEGYVSFVMEFPYLQTIHQWKKLQSRDIRTAAMDLHPELTTEEIYAAPINSDTILVVEDNVSLRDFIARELSKFYKVCTATDGADGIQKALDIAPDLILSDVMMPVKSGLELCDEIKGDARSSHIPVVLLTARSGDEHEIEGYKYGADAYVTKPFQMDVLLAQIKNIFIQRERLKKKYSRLSIVDEDMHLVDTERDFLLNLQHILDENLDSEELNADMLATRLLMSKSALYKKIKNMAGVSVHVLIRNHRLIKAGDLLKSNNLTVSQVCYMVGFSDLNYFSKSFKNYYGVVPSKFKNATAIK